MQIHEVTQRPGGFGSAIGDELETLAFGSPITKYDELAPKATPKDQGPTADQYSAAEKTRLDKQAAAAKAAQDQMAPFSKFQPAAKPAPSTQVATTTPDPEVLDPVAKAAQTPAAARPGDVIDVDARVVSDPAKIAKLPQPAPAQLPRPAAQLPASAAPAQLPRPVVPNYAQTNKVGYRPATVNAPVAAVPNMPPTVPPKPAAPVVNPAAKPEVYVWDGQPLNPKNPVHARLIAQMQAAGVTKAKTRAPKR